MSELDENERRRLMKELIRENRVSYFVFGFTVGIITMALIYLVIKL